MLDKPTISAPPSVYLQQESGMTNEYRIDGDTATIVLTRRDGQRFELVIDRVDLPRVLALPGRIYASVHQNKRTTLVYARTIINRRVIAFHRWLLDAPDGIEVDHRDHCGLNNRRRNLRLVSHQENLSNRRMMVWQLTKGVVKSNQRERWAAFVWLGEFDSPDKAERVYDEAHAILSEAGVWEGRDAGATTEGLPPPQARTG